MPVRSAVLNLDIYALHMWRNFRKLSISQKGFVLIATTGTISGCAILSNNYQNRYSYHVAKELPGGAKSITTFWWPLVGLEGAYCNDLTQAIQEYEETIRSYPKDKVQLLRYPSLNNYWGNTIDIQGEGTVLRPLSQPPEFKDSNVMEKSVIRERL